MSTNPETYYDTTGNEWQGQKGNDNAPFVTNVGTNEIIYDGSVTYTGSNVSNTAKNVDIALPAFFQGDAIYEIVGTNPSSESDITVVVKNKETFGGTARYPEVTRFNVPKSSPDGVAVLVQGWMLGEGARLTVLNPTATTVTFQPFLRVRKV